MARIEQRGRGERSSIRPWTEIDRELTLEAIGLVNRQIVSAWIAREAAREIPWTPLARPLAECRVALVSTAALALHGDTPFDQEGERRDPWWGDPSYRVLPRGTRTGDARSHHLHIDASVAERDLECLMPLSRLAELEAEGVVGASAPSHYSFMGYILKPKELLERSTPAMIERMKAEGVDAVLLVPV
jgi:D-proline reductase (dithiol) PrdB